MKRGGKILAVLLLALWCSFQPAMVHATEAQPPTEAQTEAVTGLETEPQTEEEGRQGGGYNSKQTFGIDTELDGLSGQAKYVGSQYRDNYKLDLEKTGITELLDAGLNAVANMLFSAIKMVGMGLITFIYFCLDFNFADTFSGFLTSIQTNLIGGVYEQLWLLAVMILAGFILVKMVKRDLAGVLLDFGMVIFVSVLSLLMLHNSATILTVTTNLTKNISSTVFEGLDSVTQEEQNNKSYAQNAAGALWVDLVHVPWLTMEFGDAQVDEEMVEKILSLQPGSSDRKDLVEDLNDETGCFDKSRGIDRLGMLLCYLVPFGLKLVVLAAVAAMQMLGQFLAVFVILLATFVLILALVPTYGIEVIRKWINKFVDVHLSMMILSFLLALMLWLNKVLFSYAGTFGWFITLLIQAVLCLILFMNFRTILHLLLHPRDGMQDLQRMMRMMARQNRGGGYDRHKDHDKDGDSHSHGQNHGGGQGPYYYGQGAYYKQDPYYGSGSNENAPPSYTAPYQTPPPLYGTGGQPYEEEGAQTARHYHTPDEGAYMSPPEQSAREATDYDAIRRAPTQQELYDLYQEDERSARESGMGDNQEQPAESGDQAKPIHFQAADNEQAGSAAASAEHSTGHENGPGDLADATLPQSGEPAGEGERKPPIRFQESGNEGQGGHAQSQEKIRLPEEEAQAAPVSQAPPQSGYARPQAQETREATDPAGERPEMDAPEKEEIDVEETD